MFNNMKKLKKIDLLKGLAVSVLTAALFTIQDISDLIFNDASVVFEWKKILMACISAGAGYLIKNLLTNSKT